MRSSTSSWTTSEDPSLLSTRFLPIYAAVAFDLAAFGMAFTDIALRARSYNAAPWLVGLILSSYFLFQIVSSPRWGAVSDRVGRKPVAVLCTVLSAMSMVVYALMPSLEGIVLSRILAGFAAANVAIIQASLADSTEGDARASAMGKFSAAINVGLIVGFAGGGVIAEQLGARSMGFVGASLSALAAVCLWFGMPNLAPKGKPDKPKDHFGLGLLRDHPTLTRLFILAAISWFSLACLEGTFAQLLQINFGQGQTAFGLILMLEMVLGFLLQSLFFERIQRRFGKEITLRAGYVFMGLGLAATPFAPNLGVLIAVGSLYAVGKGLADPSMNLLTSEATPEDRQGEMFGLLQSARNLGFLGGPSLGGYLFGISVAIPYVVAGAVSLAAAGLASRSQAKLPN